jgi:hypothetical protein
VRTSLRRRRRVALYTKELHATRNALTKNGPAKVELVKAHFLGFGVIIIVDFAGPFNIVKTQIRH